MLFLLPPVQNVVDDICAQNPIERGVCVWILRMAAKYQSSIVHKYKTLLKCDCTPKSPRGIKLVQIGMHSFIFIMEKTHDCNSFCMARIHLAQSDQDVSKIQPVQAVWFDHANARTYFV